MNSKLSLLIASILVLSLVIVYPINHGVAPTLPTVFVDPPITEDSSKVVGSTFTIRVNISNVQNLYGWQVNMTYNPTVVNTTLASIVEGPFLKDAITPPGTIFLKKIDNVAGKLLASSSSKTPYPLNGASGNGTLVYITFKVKAEGRATLLQLVQGTTLNEMVSGTPVPIPHETEDGVFDNRIGNSAPVAAFSIDPLVANVSGTVNFNASASYDPDAWLVSYQWNYGDGITEVYLRELLENINLTAKATHVYAHAKIYTVTLTVTDNDGETATATATTTIGHDVVVTKVNSSAGIAVMRGTEIVVNVTVGNRGYPYAETFNVTAYYNDTAIDTQKIVDMPVQTESTFTFKWNTTGVDLGKYVLKANTTTIEGDYDSSNNEYVDGTITIALTNIIDYPVVVSDFTFHVIVESTSTTANFQFSRTEKKTSLDVTGQDGTGGFSNITIPNDLLGGPYTVLFDDLPITPQETSNSTHTFLYLSYTHSTHTVNVVGATVATPPVAIFTTSTTHEIAGNSITFNATDSYDPDGTIEDYRWNFGDGASADSKIAEHAYTAAGNYTITLTVTDNKQLTNSTHAIITIIDYPQAAFTCTPTAPLEGETVSFDASASTPKGGVITGYKWDFGDGATATGVIATRAYSTVGNYLVVLNVTDSEGLWNTETKTLIILTHDVAITELTVTPNSVKIGEQVTITIKVVNKGNFTETFGIAVYHNDTLIETRTVANLAPGTLQTVTTLWNTTNVTSGTHTIKAVATTVAGETKTEDNTFAGGTVTITVQEEPSNTAYLYIIAAITIIAVIATAVYLLRKRS